jgi:hypothetical protein
LRPIQASDVESFSADENDKDLATYHYEVDDDEEGIFVNGFENIELVVKATVAVQGVSIKHPHLSVIVLT